MAKVTGALDQMQAWARALGDRVDIGTITVAGALPGYLDGGYADPTGAAAARPWPPGTKGLASGRRCPRWRRRRRLEPYASAARISAVGRTRPRRGRMFSTEKQ
jgi:hypothetical protein